MKVSVLIDESAAKAQLPEVKADGSGVGVNYADQILKPFKMTLPDGRKMLAKRRGLKITVTIGDRQGEALLRRLDNGPDVQNMFRKALEEAAQNAGATLTFEPGAIHVQVDEV